MALEAIRGFTLLHDTTWRDHWEAWLDFAGLPGIDTRAGPAFSLYGLAVEAALDGAGMLIGRRALVQHLIAQKRLVAPFGIVMPAPTRLCLLLGATRADSMVAAVADWLVKERVVSSE